MISICTVILEPAYKFLDIYKESILQRTSLISEVIICDLRKPNDFYKENYEKSKMDDEP